MRSDNLQLPCVNAQLPYRTSNFRMVAIVIMIATVMVVMLVMVVRTGQCPFSVNDDVIGFCACIIKTPFTRYIPDSDI